MALSRIDTTNMIEDVPQSKLDNNINFRNLIINGDMSIDQRNSGSSVTATNGGYTVDRWLTGSSQSSKFTVDQETDAPTGFSYSVKLTSSAATTPGASDQYWFAQNIEGFNTAYLEYGNSNAKTVTVSFHVKSSLTGTFSGSLMNSAYNYSHPFTYSISSANTWEKKSVVITGATAGTWIGATNGVGLRMYFSLGNGSNFLGTAGSWSASQNNGATGETQLVGTSGATLFITGVQLEAGTSASDFEFLPVDVNLQRCQRYYEHTFVYGTAYDTSTNVGKFLFTGGGNSTQRAITLHFTEQKRTIPTITYTQIQVDGGGTLIAQAFTSDKQLTVEVNGGSAGRQFFGHYKAEAEL